MTMRTFRTLGPLVVAFATTGCFATREDVRVLQSDMAVLRAEANRADSLHREQVRQVQRSVGAVADTLKLVNVFISRMQGDLTTQLHLINRQLATVQELTGQSQKRLLDIRADIEAQQLATAAATAAAAAAVQAANNTMAGGAPASTPGAPAPGGAQTGPNQLYQLAQAQLRRGSASSARAGFQELLAQFPTSELAPDAQFGIAESYAAEANGPAADSAYSQVVVKYPKSDKAPTALYKRATTMRLASQTRQARTIYQQIVDKYPRSDEAVLSAEFLRTMK